MKDDVCEKIYEKLTTADIHRQLIEEMAELTQALCKLDRIGTLNPSKWDDADIIYQVHEEVADVKNLLRMLTYEPWYESEAIWGMRVQKMKRWEERLNDVL